MSKTIFRILLALKHLPGQHNQATHGRKKNLGGSEILPPNTPVGEVLPDLESRKKIVNDAIKKMEDEAGIIKGVDIEIHETEGYEFSVGEDRYQCAGDYSADNKRVRLFNGAFRSTPEGTHGIVAHELTHHLFSRVMSRFDSDRADMIKLDREYSTSGRQRQSPLRADESLRTHYYKEVKEGNITFVTDEKIDLPWANHFPVYAALNDTWVNMDFRDRLRKEDGVTDYSASYWKKLNTSQHWSRDFLTAVNETLAEVNFLKIYDNARYKKVSRAWRKFSNALEQAYKARKRQDKEIGYDAPEKRISVKSNNPAAHYFNDKWEMTDKDHASIIKVIYPNGDLKFGNGIK